MTLAEVVNQPARFVYDYATHGGGVAPTHVARNIFVVGATEWVLWCVFPPSRQRRRIRSERCGLLVGTCL